MKPAPPVTQTVRELIAKPLSRRDVTRLEPLGRRFYQRDTVAVARALLGKVLVRRLPEGIVAVRLVEVEAYLGVGDRACHSSGGRRTARNQVMWGEAGHLYVYFTYGMHHCANVVTRRVGVPEAVLLRGAVPLFGRELLVARRAGRDGERALDGPARLAQALGLDRTDNGVDLTTGGAVFLADDGFRWRPEWTAALPRVGVAYAGAAAGWPLRFLAVAARRPGGSRARRGARGGAAAGRLRQRGRPAAGR
jgi:DNA-3-methyladenine glycosylase